VLTRAKSHRKLPPYVIAVRSKGNEYFYFRRHRSANEPGMRVRIPGRPFRDDAFPDPDWWETYRKLADLPEPENAPSLGARPAAIEAPSETARMSSMISQYRLSPDWAANSQRTQSEWTRHLSRIEAAWGRLPPRRLTREHVLNLRDYLADTPAEANNLVRTLSALLSWGVNYGWLAANPCLKLPKLKLGGSNPYLPWSWDEIQLLESVARPAMWQAAALALYTGQRLGNVLRLRWADIVGSELTLTQFKTRKSLTIRIHANLRALLETIPRNDDFILTSTKGKAWTTNSFNAAWQRQMNDPRLDELRRKGLVFHGLRKSAVVMLLEAGCTDAEVAAITGQSRSMVEHYARAVNQRKLAAAAILKWEGVERS